MPLFLLNSFSVASSLLIFLMSQSECLEKLLLEDPSPGERFGFFLPCTLLFFQHYRGAWTFLGQQSEVQTPSCLLLTAAHAFR